MTEKTKTKYEFMPYWKNEEKCFDEAKVEGKVYPNLPVSLRFAKGHLCDL
jgi:hypothetical protein